MNNKYDIKELAKIVGGKIISEANDAVVYDFSIDTRKIVKAEKCVFIAIAGDHNNGHDYIQNAYNKGVRSFILESKPDTFNEKNCSIIQVNNSLKALQLWMTFHRQKFQIPVLAITGSNGKTIVKEWLNLMLSDSIRICRSPNSYNSQVGVPLSLSHLDEQAELGIFEAGISLPGEMENLEKMIQPNLGLLTNIGTAHLNNFDSVEQLIREKCKLFKNCQIVFTSDKNKKVLDALRVQRGVWKLWGKSDKADLKILEQEKMGSQNRFKLEFEDEVFELKTKFNDEASLENVLSCVLVLLHLNYDFAAIQERVDRIKTLPMRLEILQGQFGSTIINDAYTLDYNSLEIALNELDQISKNQKKVLVLSDFDASNSVGDKVYENLQHLKFKHEIDTLIGIGSEFVKNKEQFSSDDIFYRTRDEFLEEFNLSFFADKTILIKGSRANELEKIVLRLQKKNHRTVLEINLNALSGNLKYFKSLLQPQVKLMVMVKAYSYGSGSKEVAQVLEFNGVDYLGVAYADEGVELRADGISIPIMVMNPEADNFDTCFRYNLEPEIYSLDILRAYIDKLPFQLSDDKFKIHLKLDTGMNRLGFLPNEIDQVIQILNEYPQIKVEGILTHLAASDNLDKDDFTFRQLEEFEKLANQVEVELGYVTIKHALNTSGILRFPKQFDMVRLGIGLHGISPVEAFQKNLNQVATFKSKITQIKKIHPGDSVGYNREFIANEEMKIAIIPVGYADGLPRILSKGNGHLWIKDKKASILGNVCMDMTMVDVTEIDCKVDDEVILFSPKHSIQDLAQSAHTISYEIMTSLSSRVRRVYVND